MVLAARQDGSDLSIASATRCVETGAFRFTFVVDGREVSADLTVSFYAEQGLAYLRFVTVDHVYASDALTAAVEAWVRCHVEAVFAAALQVTP